MHTLSEISINDKIYRIALLVSVPFLISFLFMNIQTGPVIAWGVFVAAALLTAFFIDPFIALTFCFFVLFSGIVWGLEIPKGFLPFAIISIVSWIGKKSRTFDWEFVWDRQGNYLLAFLAFVFLSVPGAYDPLHAFKYTFVYFKLMVFYLFVLNVIKTKRQVWYLIYTMIFSILISVVYGFYQLFLAWGSPTQMLLVMRMRGLTDSPNSLALHALFIFPVFVLLFFKEGWSKKSVIYLGIVFLLTSGIIATFSRGGSIAFAAVTFVLLYLKRSWRLFMAILILLLIVFLLIIPPEFIQHLGTLTDVGKFLQDESLRERSKLFMGATHLFLENPIFGIGVGNFILLSREFVLRHLVAHNIVLQIASEIGLFGCIFFMLAFFRTFKNLSVARKKFELEGEETLALVIHGLSIGFFGIFIGAMFLSIQEYFVVWTIFGFSVALRRMSSAQG